MEVQQGIRACENRDHTQNGKEDSNNQKVELSFATDSLQACPIANKGLDYEYFIFNPN